MADNITSFTVLAGTPLRIDITDDSSGYQSRVTVKLGEDMTFSAQSVVETYNHSISFKASGLLSPDFVDLFNTDCVVIAPIVTIRKNYD
jgi:hypothetical protein